MSQGSQTPQGSQDRVQPVLDVQGLRVVYHTSGGDVQAVHGLDLRLWPGEIVGLVGESGCGKTTAAMGILRLVQPPGRIEGGRVLLAGQDLMGLRSEDLRRMRWRKLALIPQGAMNSLNPVLRVGRQLEDVIRTHEKGLFRQNLKERILGQFRSVGLPDRVYGLYPHELSGGMKQRVCIAMAIALGPPLIIADEPTSALDVVVQRTVAQTLLGIKEKMGVTLLVIGHDMGLMAQLADRLVVMYAGHVVEIARIEAIFDRPLHPYTQLLIESVPSVRSRKPLKVTEGLTHDLRHLPKGCVFQYRCEKVHEACRITSPERSEVEPGHEVACWLYRRGLPQESL